MSYNSQKNGAAEYNNYMQITSGALAQVDEGPDITSYDPATRYAQYVYQINSEPVTISGDVYVDTVGIDDSGDVKVEGDALKVYDAAAIAAINNISISETHYSQIIRESGTFTYIMKATPGTLSGAASWQVKRINDDGAGATDFEWADGDSDFDNIASNYASLTYSL